MKFIYSIAILISFSIEGFSQKYLLEQDVNKDTLIPKVGHRRKFDLVNYTGYAFAAGPNTQTPPSDIKYFNSWEFREGLWGRVKLSKTFAVGTYIEYARDGYKLKNSLIKDSVNNAKILWNKQVNNNIVLGLFTRINFKNDRIFMDVGAYYAYDCLPRFITKIKPQGGDYNNKKTTYTKPAFMNRNNYGIDLRLTSGKFSLYGRYRITDLYKNNEYDLPKFMFGILIDYKN